MHAAAVDDDIGFDPFIESSQGLASDMQSQHMDGVFASFAILCPNACIYLVHHSDQDRCSPGGGPAPVGVYCTACAAMLGSICLTEYGGMVYCRRSRDGCSSSSSMASNTE